MITGYVLFFLTGLAFGYAAPGRWKWLPLLLPLALFLLTAFLAGVDATTWVRLAVALLVTVGGVLLGALLERRGQSAERARYA